jgi:hypothetical protein
LHFLLKNGMIVLGRSSPWTIEEIMPNVAYLLGVQQADFAPVPFVENRGGFDPFSQ